MAVSKDLCGRYIQTVAKMRFGSDLGDSVRHVESHRPFVTTRGKRHYQDGGPGGDKSVQEEPTYVWVEANDAINVQLLIVAGGLIPAPLTPAEKKAAKPAAKPAAKKKVKNG